MEYTRRGRDAALEVALTIGLLLTHPLLVRNINILMPRELRLLQEVANL